ncbi:hypothetical protein [Flavobacterium sp. ALD4]|nr:hypothetical protein [Flavobacterium sp. ALD4]
MQKNNHKTLKTIAIVFSIIIVLFFVHFALGHFLAGWNSVN